MAPVRLRARFDRLCDIAIVTALALSLYAHDRFRSLKHSRRANLASLAMGGRRSSACRFHPPSGHADSVCAPSALRNSFAAAPLARLSRSRSPMLPAPMPVVMMRPIARCRPDKLRVGLCQEVSRNTSRSLPAARSPSADRCGPRADVHSAARLRSAASLRHGYIREPSWRWRSMPTGRSLSR